MSSTEFQTGSPTSPKPSLTTRLVGRTNLLRRSVWHSIFDLTSNQVYTHASAIAFNALLSFFPFILLLLVICKKLLGWQSGFEMLLSLLKDDYMPAGGEFITRNLRRVSANHTTALLSLGSLLFTSTGLFKPIELALNRAWGVASERNFWRSYLVGFGLVFACGLLAMVSIFITASLQAFLRGLLGEMLNNLFFRFIVALLIKVIILPVTITIFFIIYYFLPNRTVPIRRVLPAAIFIGLLWELSKYFFNWCLPILDFATVYGPFYITVSLVTWAFISSLLLLLGANLSAHWPE